MIDLLNLLRAKSEGENNLLLKDHILETILREEELENFVKDNCKAIEFQMFNDNTAKRKFFDSLIRALFLHDLGKITYEFQSQVYKKSSLSELTEGWIELDKFLGPIKGLKIRHEILSSIWSSIILFNDEFDDWIRTAILLHHYNDFYDKEEINLINIIECFNEQVISYLNFLYAQKEELKKILNDLLVYICSETKNDIVCNALADIKSANFEDRLSMLIRYFNDRDDKIFGFAKFFNFSAINPDYNFLTFLGSLRRCDYSASGVVHLELQRDIESVYQNLEEKIKNNVGTNYLWQEETLNNVKSGKSLVLIAPTGSGKTEFSIMWAKKNSKKLIYTLPLRVALNDLFLRFKNDKDGYFDEDFVDILHSTAFLEYFKKDMLFEDLDIEKKMTAAKLLSSPILLTTPDQIFLVPLQYYGSDKILSIFPLSSIVIDEVQTYDEEMASIIIKAVGIIKEKLNGSVLVMTATYPPYFEKFFKQFGFELEDTANIKNHVKNYNLKRHKIRVENKSLFNYSDEDIEMEKDEVNSLIANFKNKSLLFVVNNVKKAILLYKFLIKENDNVEDNIYLLHSRLLEKEKSRRITEIKDLLDHGKEVKLISTQVVEASVNLDFEFMVTEVSTIDSQIQRWGRIYRNRSENYQGNPNIVIYTGIDKGTMAIYDRKVLEKTVEVLNEFNGILLDYDDERKMIKQTFDKETEDESGISKTLKNIYIEKIEQNLNFINGYIVTKKSEAQRLFRRIAGVNVIFPDIMEHSDNKIAKELAKIVKDETYRIKSWEELVIIIKEKTLQEIDKWALKAELYKYSLNLPEFYRSKILHKRNSYEFKGFLSIELNKENNEEELVKMYGIDALIEKNKEDYFYQNW